MTFKEKRIVSEWLKGTLKLLLSLVVLSFVFLPISLFYHSENSIEFGVKDQEELQNESF